MKFIINTVLLTSIVAIISMVFSVSSFEFKYLIFLPIATLVLTGVFRPRLKGYEGSIVLMLFLLQVTIRYLVLPMQLAFNPELTFISNPIYRGYTIFFMILELLVAYIAFALYEMKYKRVQTSNSDEITLIYPNVINLIIIGVIFAYIALSGYFSRVNYIWNLTAYMEISRDLEEVSSLAAVLFKPVRLIASLMVISYVYKKQFNKTISFILLFLVVFVNSIIIVGTSRFSIVLSIMPLAVIIYQLFKGLRKPMIIGLSIVLFISISISTAQKFDRGGGTSHEYSSITPNTLNAYFSGPGNQSKGIELYYSRDSWDRLEFFITDLIQNVPTLAKYANDDYKTNIYFNEALYGHRLFQIQIVPLSLSGLIHFGIIGPMIYPFLFIALALYFERRFLLNSNLGYKLVFITLAMTLSLVFMLNIGSLTSSIFNNLVILFVPIYFINKSNKLKTL